MEDVCLGSRFEEEFHHGVTESRRGVWRSLRDDGRGTLYKSEGDRALGGAITFVMREPLTLQRGWSQSVDVPTAT
ncbi:hypothetical protein LBMAG42_49920 [Deltaproteobacteria bacterium]|nr:hypothetical protein LBMAG42_49920 [Deltaproteobacteria bacterium]